MNRNPRHSLWLLCALVALAFGLAGCGGDEPAPVAAPPAPAPAPPPFQPQPVEVALGDNGGTATLMTTEAGGFTLNGEAFTGGADSPVEGEGGRKYVLTLADGTWSAAFQPMEVAIALGTSGDSATLMTTEVGGFTLGGEAFESGGTAMSSAGGSYTLTVAADGTWSAAFMPMTVTVTLGTSGSSVELMTTEAGGFTLGGEAFASGGTYASGGLTYRLSLADGEWSAAFVPMTVTVALGTSGTSVTLSSTETGGWAVGSSAVVSGGTRTADNGNQYTLTLAADGTWSAAFAPMKVSARLGGSGEVADLWTTEAGGVTLDGAAVASGTTTTTNTAGETYVLSMADGTWSGTHRPASQSVSLDPDNSVTLMTNEAGRWTLDGAAVSSGQTVAGGSNAATGANNQYVLTLDGDTWSAAYQAATMTIAGTGLTASAKEDGTGYTVGDGADAPSLPASGSGTITGPGGAMFRVAKDSDGMLAGTRFDADIEGSVMTVNPLVHSTGANPTPALRADNRETAVNEKNTALNALGAAFSVGDLLGAGVATAEGDNIVAKARADMVKIRDRVAGLVALRRDGGLTADALRMQLDVQWVAADKVALAVFGQIDDVNPSLEKTTSESRVLDAFDRLVDALSSVEAFQAATLANGPDKLQGFKNLSAAAAATAFNRVAWWSTARLGSLGSTRFGAAVWNNRDNATANDPNPERAQAFAWSTMLQTRRSSDVRVSGAANYQGRTHAADQAGNLYAGAIDINVRFTRGTVDGRVDGLERADTGNPFVHGLGGAVTGIVLPTAKLSARAEWSVTTPANSSSPGRLQYAALAGGQPDFNLSQGSTFAGRLLGRGDQAGSEAIGTWEAKIGSTTLAGGFGAARGADTEPPGAAVTEDRASIGKTGSVWARLERKPATLAARAASAGPPVVTARPEINSPDVLNTGNAKFKYVPQQPDTAAAAADDTVEYVVGDYTPDRAAVLEDQDWDATKGNWVSSARAEIVKKLAQLRRSIALDGADASDSDTQFANDQRQRLFTEIQDELKKIFGDFPAVADDPDTMADEARDAIYTGVLTRDTVRNPSSGWTAHVDYPVNSSGVAQDAAVLAEIEDVIEALESAEAFAAALADGGLFAATRTASAPVFPANSGGYPSAGDIFNRARGKLLIAADETAYTRLGAWRHQISEYAADALSTQNYERGERGLELGSFAYSPLDPTAAYSNVNNRLYPGSGADGTVSATYSGKTVAAQGDLFYRGDVEARVYWSPSTVADSEITIEISDLEETVTGDTLQVGNVVPVSETDATLRPGVKDVESLTWRLGITNTGEVRFGGSDTVEVGVSVNSLNENPFRPAYDDQVRFVRDWDGSGKDSYRFGTADAHFIAQADGEGAGTDTQDDFGKLTLTMVKPAGAAVRAATAAEITQFAADQNALKYPTYAVGGPQIQFASEPVNNANVMLFADGSMLMFGEPGTSGSDALTTPWRRAIGIEPVIVPGSIRANLVSGTPVITADENEYFFSGPTGGYVARAYPVIGNPPGPNSGIGAPAMSTDALFEAFVRSNDYVNVLGTDAELASKVEGMFVGQDQDGPLGIIGTWELTGGIFGTEDNRGIIRGAFGADIQP